MNWADNESGGTALMVATWQGHLGVVKNLLEHGALPLHQDRQGFTALMVAEAAGNDAIAQVLAGDPAGNGGR